MNSESLPQEQLYFNCFNLNNINYPIPSRGSDYNTISFHQREPNSQVNFKPFTPLYLSSVDEKCFNNSSHYHQDNTFKKNIQEWYLLHQKLNTKKPILFIPSSFINFLHFLHFPFLFFYFFIFANSTNETRPSPLSHSSIIPSKVRRAFSRRANKMPNLQFPANLRPVHKTRA